MKEYRGFQIGWDEENKIVRFIGSGLFDEDKTNWMSTEIDVIVAEHGKKLKWLIDMSKMTRTSAKSRKRAVPLIKNAGVGKCAILSASVFLKTVINFVNIASGLENFRHFSSDEAALEWLNKE